MTAPVALVTSDPFREHDADLPLLTRALATRGIEADVVAWDAPVDWAAYAGAVVRSTWDYTTRRDPFLAWIDAAAAATRLANPPALLRWNTDKRYLLDLAAAGVPVTPTIVVAPGQETVVPDAWADVVVKPAVSAGGRDTARVPSPQAAERLVRRLHAGGHTALVQPYLSDVDRAGEIDVICFGGVPSHAVRKGAILISGAEPPPDERLAHGQAAAPVSLDDAPLDLVDTVIEALGRLGMIDAAPLYARVDCAVDREGRWVLMEAELVEPHLFLSDDPGAADRMADALVAWLKR